MKRRAEILTPLSEDAANGAQERPYKKFLFLLICTPFISRQQNAFLAMNVIFVKLTS